MYLPGEIDARVMTISVGICLLVTLIVGIIPAFQTRHLDLAGPLKAESSGVVGARGRAWMRSGLVVFQVSLSFILLVGAALLLKSLENIRTASPGFTFSSVVTTGVSLVAAGYDDARAKTFQDELIDRLIALPGVQSAAFARVTPLGNGTSRVISLRPTNKRKLSTTKSVPGISRLWGSLFYQVANFCEMITRMPRSWSSLIGP